MVALLAGCAARMVGHPPALTSRQVEELRQSTKDKVVRVELAAPDARPLELRNVEFLPKAISGTSAEGPRTVAVSDTSALVWDDTGGGVRTGMLVGVLTGALLGGTISAFSCKSDTGVCAIAGPVGAGIGGLGGLVLGAIIGGVVGADGRFRDPAPSAPAHPDEESLRRRKARACRVGGACMAN